jgi:hypothetical protein
LYLKDNIADGFEGKACVFTALFGNYEVLNEQPQARNSPLPFICFTDDPDLRSETWQIRLSRPLLALDPIRSQRDIKIRAHRHLPEFSASLYIDNSVILREDPAVILARCPAGCAMALYEHGFRETLSDEFLEVARLGLDDPSRIYEQLNHYALSHPDLLTATPWWGGMLLRRHNDPIVRKMQEIWADHVLRYSRRDQLSLLIACHEAGLAPFLLSGTSLAASTHEWPVALHRKRGQWPRDPAATLVPLAARLRSVEPLAARAMQAEQALEAMRTERDLLLASTSWRVTAPLRAIMSALRASPRRGALPAILTSRIMPGRIRLWMQQISKIRQDFMSSMGRLPVLFRPQCFTDKMQWRKLFELEPVFANVSCKIAAREYVTARIGPNRQAELLWSGADPEAIPFDDLIPPYVIKSSHASGHVIVVRAGETVDRDAIRRAARGWLAHCHGTAMSEPAYIHLPRRVIIERLLMMPDGSPPIERCVMVFNGRAEFIQTRGFAADGSLRSAGFHRRDWTYVPIQMRSVPDKIPPARPALLSEILEVSERLAAGLSHARVDIYDFGDRLMVGEITLYSWSGLFAFKDPAHDVLLGEVWEINRPMWRAIKAIALGRWEIHPPEQ